MSSYIVVIENNIQIRNLIELISQCPVSTILLGQDKCDDSETRSNTKHRPDQ